MTRVIRSEADLSRLLARPGYRLASQIGGEVVNTDQRAGRMPCRPAPTDPGVQTVQPSPPSTSGMAVATAGLTRTAACDGASAATQTPAQGVRLDHAMRTTPGGASRCVGKFQPVPAGLAPGPLTPSKYGNTKTNGYASKREAKRAADLRALEHRGLIRNLREQVKYLLIPAAKDAEGKTIERACSIVLDFVYEEAPTWNPVHEDCKGFRTEVYRIKRKLFYFVYGYCIRET